MNRFISHGFVLTAALALGACSDGSRPMASNDSYRNSDGMRFDRDGNRMYDQSVSDHVRVGYSDSDRGGYPGNRYGNDDSQATSSGSMSRTDRTVQDHPWHANDQTSHDSSDGKMRDGQWQRSDDMNNRNMRDSQNHYSDDKNNRNMRDGQGQRSDDMNNRNMRDGQGQRSDNSRSNWSDRSSTDHDIVMVGESELPSAARTGLSSEAGGTSLSETGRGMWNGAPCYCAKVTKNGHPYKVMTDSDGVLIMMHRLD